MDVKTSQASDWMCQFCGHWVMAGQLHYCTGGAAHAIATPPTVPNTAPLDRVASALERIATALEQPRADVYLIGKKQEDE